MSGLLLWAAVAALGGCGGVARVLVDRRVTARAGGRFPAGTFVVNASGSAVLGLLAGLGTRGDALLLAGTALLGSYTTFSTWMLETQRLAGERAGRLAALNVLVSLAAGLAAVVLGRALGRVL